MSVKIKICGIRTFDDIRIMNRYRPDFTGFILAKSQRKVEIPELKSLLKELNIEITPVGVFVNETIDKVLEAIEVGIRVVQLHGDESEEYIEALTKKLENSSIKIWKAIRIGEDPLGDMLKLENYVGVDGILLDRFSAKAYGGTGEVFNWKSFEKYPFKQGIILAGGLKAENVMTGIQYLKPFCVDVSSGVELDGKKDENKVKELISLLRENK